MRRPATRLRLAIAGSVFNLIGFPSIGLGQEGTAVEIEAEEGAESKLEAAPEAAPNGEPATPWWRTLLDDTDVWLFGTQGYRLRGIADGKGTRLDNDLRLVLQGGASTWQQRLQLEVAAAAYIDLDGRDGGSSLRSVHDPTGSVDLLLQEFSASYRGDRWLPRVSAGRITVLRGWPIMMDGAAVTIRPLGLMAPGRLFGLERSELFFNAGRTAYFYDIDPSLVEDWTAQLGASFFFMQWASLEVDYRALAEDLAANGVDHDYGAAARLRIGRWVSARAYARGLNLSLARLGGHGLFSLPMLGFDASVRVDAQTVELGAVNEKSNPFFAILGPSYPYLRFNLLLSEQWTFPLVTLAARAGGAGRVRLDGPDELYNRTWARAWASVEGTDVLVDGVYASVTVDYSLARFVTDEGAVSVGGVVGFRRRLLAMEVGSDYQRYKYTYYQAVEEIADVRTLWTSVRAPLWGPFALRADYRLEIFDRTEHTLSISIVESLDGAPFTRSTW